MDIRKITSVADIILTGAAEKPEAEMIVFEGQSVTWQEMKDRAGQAANAMAADGV